ncbi:hypothetical protein C0993_003128 [Termitomyces sp. T159_Od127]|nr:hypothetical protein C0993_003128 [Termitomyces sp. T159_Od127]
MLHIFSESNTHHNTQTHRARRTIPTAKLTDKNNLEQPKLPFQRKAVDAYCKHQAQDTASRLGSSKDDAVSNAMESQQPSQAGNKQDLVSDMAETSGCKRPIVLNSDDDSKGHSTPPVKKMRVSLGNPMALGDDGFLADIDVQLIQDEEPEAELHEDKRRDIDQFFHQPVMKEIKGKEKKYCICKICP